MPDSEEVKPKTSLSSIHDFLFTPGVVQPPYPTCDLKAIKYKTKIEFNQRVSGALKVFAQQEKGIVNSAL